MGEGRHCALLAQGLATMRAGGARCSTIGDDERQGRAAAPLAQLLAHVIEETLRRAFARAATLADAKLLLEQIECAGSGMDGVPDLRFRHAFADADVHARATPVPGAWPSQRCGPGRV